MKKDFKVKPSLFGACMRLTGRNAVTAGMLCQILIRSNKKTLKDEHGVSGWISMTRDMWMVVTGYSRHQHDAALKNLKKKGLIKSRRRKLSYKDPYAQTWIIVAEGVKSAIEEIMKEEGISAWGDTANKAKTVSADKPEAIKCDISDELIEMNEISKKKEIYQNEFLEKKSEEAKLQESKKIEKSISDYTDDEVWNMFSQLYIFWNSEPPEKDKKILKDIRFCSGRLNMLKKYNISLRLSQLDVSDDDDSWPYALRALAVLFYDWLDFGVFLKIACGAWNIPMRPQMTYMKLHIDGALEYLVFQHWLHVHKSQGKKLSFGYEELDFTNKELIEAFLMEQKAEFLPD